MHCRHGLDIEDFLRLHWTILLLLLLLLLLLHVFSLLYVFVRLQNVNCAEVKQRNVKSDNQTAKPQPKVRLVHRAFTGCT